MTTVVMVRDLGSLRQPPIFIALIAFVIFAIFCYLLHVRDKEIWAAKAAAGQLAGAGAGAG